MLDELGPIDPSKTGRSFKAIFGDAILSAKALYTSPENGSNVGHLKFVYDKSEHEGEADYIYEVSGNFNEYNYPS